MHGACTVHARHIRGAYLVERNAPLSSNLRRWMTSTNFAKMTSLKVVVEVLPHLPLPHDVVSVPSGSRVRQPLQPPLGT